jgi:hypothetical protein
MTPKNLKLRLEAMADSERFSEESEALAKALQKTFKLEHASVIVDFMAHHPDIDYGMPGALTHLVETIGDKDYEEIICRSVVQKPTSHTAWMLHRLSNAAKTAKGKARLMTVLKQARIKAKGDPDLIADIDGLLS